MKIYPISISCTDSKYVTLKAKEVVGHNSKRALNELGFRLNPGIYSCAVDAFVEVSTHLYSHQRYIFLSSTRSK